ncbi:glucose-6-phosphate isomerase-like [Bacillus rossius redtenbacheri]|uniref:glucose-6-phosphate isomerase-like n=1 Tax=Bacillus rossius redtenbacheri TaxID=93214 RepID=UPI002FDDB685
MDVLPKLTDEPAWKLLEQYYRNSGEKLNINELMKKNPARFEQFSIELETPCDGGILVDYSKNRIDDEGLSLLFELARARRVERARDDVLAGKRVNFTEGEGEAVLHVALRNRGGAPVPLDGRDVMPDVEAALTHMRDFTEKVISKSWKGYTGKPIEDVVHFASGCNYMGPYMVAEALKPYAIGPRVHFVANVDGTHLAETLKNVNPETVLFIVASKTFTTLDTIVNATSAKEWLLCKSKDPSAVSKQFVGLGANVARMKEFGIDERNMFVLWDWVAGSFSLWSTIGLPIALSVGFDNFQDLLAGAHFVDGHFKTAPLERNVPVILGLLGIWYNNFFGAETHALLPYDQYLHLFPSHFQYTEMEANGKCVTLGGHPTGHRTGPVVWGAPGTSGQHTFFQLLHQGSRLVPCDFIAPARTHNPVGNGKHHRVLLANFLAQTEALMKGKTAAEVRAELNKSGKSKSQVEALLPHKVFEGNRPSNSIVVKKFTPFTLGALIAIYEYKMFVQSAIWNIDPYNFMGLDLGKELAKPIEKELENSAPVSSHDPSTNGLINFLKRNI